MQAQLIDRTHYDSQRYLFFFFFSEYWNTKRMNKAHWKLTCGRFIESTNKKVSMKANIDCKRLLKKIRLATRTRRQTTVASLPLGNLGNRLRAHEPMQSLQKKISPSKINVSINYKYFHSRYPSTTSIYGVSCTEIS